MLQSPIKNLKLIMIIDIIALKKNIKIKLKIVNK